MPDLFSNRSSALDSPGANAAEVTPSDNRDLAVTARALYIGSGGDLRVRMIGGETVVFRAVPPGILPVRVARVFAGGTTASDIVALW